MTTAIRTAARAIKALAALTALTALLAGLPYALIRFVGWPLPRTMPTWNGIQQALTHQITGPALYIDTLACLLWACWAVLALSFLIELAAAIARIPAPHVPGLGPGQILAAALIAALGLSVTARPASAATTPRLSAHLIAPSAATAPLQPSTNSSATVAASDAHAATETVHTVVPGESLWTIAQEDLGNGNEWPRIYALNADKAQPGGGTLTDPDLIKPGWTLRITPDTTATSPSTNSPAAAAPTPASPQTTAAQPTTAVPGTQPNAADTAATPQARATSAALRPAAGNGHTTASTPGAAPATPRRQPTARADAPGWIALAEGGALSAAVLAALGLALRRARRHQRWSDTCYWPRPGERPPTAPLTVPLPLRPAPRPADPEQHAPEQTGELDAYGAPYDTQPGYPHGAIPAGPGTGDLDAQPATDEASEPADREGETEQGPGRITVAAIGHRTLALHEFGPALALTGPGALGAARAIAAAALTTATPDTAGARLLIARSDAALLLEHPDDTLSALLAGVDEIELADDSAGALSYLEQYVTHRTRLLDQHDCQNLEQLPDDGEQYPPAILLALARRDQAARLTATLAASTHLRVHAVLLGEHPAAPAWHIDADGRATGDGLPADATVFDLPAPALRAAITLLANSTGHGLHAPTSITPPDPHGPLASPAWEPDPDHSPDPDTAQPPPTEPDTAEQLPADPDDQIDDARLTATPAQSATGEPPALKHAVPRDAAPGSAAGRVAAITEVFDNAAVRVKVLGVHTISTPGGDVDGKMRHDSWRLAARLAVHHRRGQHTEDLAALWPDHGDEAMRTALKHALYTLRKVLRDKSTDAAGRGRFALHITNVNNRYAFNPHLVGIDLAVFGQLRALAAETRDIGERTAAAEAALALYDGELLAGLDEEWMIAPRAMARRDALATATLLAQLADQADDPETALNWWERALSIDDNEEVYRKIITTQAQLGRRADAIATRDLLIARLDTDGASPSPETRALLAHALTRRPSPATSRAA